MPRPRRPTRLVPSFLFHLAHHLHDGGFRSLGFRPFVRFPPHGAWRHEVQARAWPGFSAALNPNQEPQQFTDHGRLFPVPAQRLDAVKSPLFGKFHRVYALLALGDSTAEASGEPEPDDSLRLLEEFFASASVSASILFSLRAAW